jgi:thiol-disulfide isomerase/thioredoxin
MKLNFFLAVIFVMFWTSGFAQEMSALDSAIQHLSKEKDPQKTVLMMNRIIKDFRLDKNKDAETFDLLYGTAAINFAMHRNYAQFEKYMGLIRNKFNQTSFLNMAASKMLQDHLDAAYANKISKRTLALYHSFKNDTTARPKDFSKEDWVRFMAFAQYPYYDTHAHSLFALKKYEEALRYQEKAFQGKPEEGLPASVERYATLLELTGKKEEAKELLLKMAGRGRLNKGMTAQLQSIYISEKGSDKNLGIYLDSLQKNIQATLIPELKQNMLHEKAPDFSFKDINGKEVKLSDYAGRIVVLDLWATWCVPCIASFPAMQLMVEKHPEVAFLFIAVEEKGPNPLARVRSFMEKRKYRFTVLMDEPTEANSSRFKIISAYQPNGIPAKYIIDANGILRFKTSGFDTDAELMNELEAMFTILKSL